MIRSTIFSLLLTSLLYTNTAYAQKQLKLRYDKPATEWTEALPVGNGRLGAMVFGKVNEELIQLNEATLWSGGPVSENVNPTAFDNLALTRAALTEGDYKKAYDLTKNMQGLYSESYLPLGDLIIKQETGSTKPANYYRDLNIADGIATTAFTVDGISYKRELFASAPGECIIIRLTASQQKKLSITVDAKSLLRCKTSVQQQSLYLDGKAPAHADPNYINYNKEPIVYEDTTGCRGMRFELIVKPIIKDGTISNVGNSIQIKDATEIVLVVSAATSFNGFDTCPDSDGKDEKKLAAEHLAKASNKKYDRLLKEHLQDFHKFFNRVS